MFALDFVMCADVNVQTTSIREDFFTVSTQMIVLCLLMLIQCTVSGKTFITNITFDGISICMFLFNMHL